MSGLFVRADAGPSIGVGHFMRMLALSEAWRARGAAVRFGGSVPEALRAKTDAPVLERPAARDDAEWTIEQARAAGASWVAADGYTFGPAFQKRVRAAGFKLLVVDDNGENGEYSADLVLNVNLHAAEAMYAQREAHTRLLLGNQHLLLRSEILKARSGPRGRLLLVTFGGADPADATALTLAALSTQPTLSEREVVVLVGAANPRIVAYREKFAREGVQLLVDPPDVAALMASAGAAICTPSTTFWELAYLGVPCAGLVVADNQTRIAQSLEKLGAMEFLGDARNISSPQRLGLALADFLSAPSDILIATARGLSDGRGASRVVSAMESF